jgi:hypothetical protein
MGGWLVPRKLIKYTPRPVTFFFECPVPLGPWALGLSPELSSTHTAHRRSPSHLPDAIQLPSLLIQSGYRCRAARRVCGASVCLWAAKGNYLA